MGELVNICGAKTRSGGVCHNKPMRNGSNRCRLHGGATPRGMASPHFKTGRYSRYLPARLQERYHEAESDSSLLELRGEISLMDARTAEILTNLQDGDTRKLWENLQSAWSEFEEATIMKDSERAKRAVNQIGRIIKRGNEIYTSWVEVYGVTDQRRKLVESERKRLVELHQTITVERLMLLITAIAGVVKEHVEDRDKLNAIQYDIQRLLSTGA